MTSSPFHTHSTMLMTCLGLALVAAGGTGPASAQTALAPTHGRPAATPALQFPIESIVVEGTSRESVRRIVRRESRLVEGGLYDEKAIALGIRRVKRLPFLLDARPTLRRGSLPGRYQLVIVVEETAVVVASGFGTFRAHSASGGVSLGANHFLGASTQVTASATVSDRNGSGPSFGRAAQLGFSRYGLFGDASRVHVDVNFGSIGGSDYRGVNSVLRIPAGRNHSFGLFATAQRSTSKILTFPPFEGPGDTGEASSEYRSVRADWVFDTTDDPFAAREGLRASAALGVRSTRLRGFGDRRDTAKYASTALAVTKPLSGNLSAVGDLSASCGELFFEEGCASTGSAALRLVKAGPRNRYRAFVEAGVSGRIRFDEVDRPFPPRNGVELRLSAGLRTRFAVVALSFFQDLE